MTIFASVPESECQIYYFNKSLERASRPRARICPKTAGFGSDHALFAQKFFADAARWVPILPKWMDFTPSLDSR